MDPASGIGVAAALIAGLVSFLSPCVLPLVPGYLSAVAGVAPGELDRAGARRVLGPSLLFVLSFSAIFVAFGLSATAIGATLNDHKDVFEKASAVLIILLGLFFLLTPFVTRLNREWRVDGLMRRAGRGGPLVAGAAFAVAWTPCIGPTLGAILTAAAASRDEGHGALLLASYSAGLAVPFIATSLFFGYMTSAFERVKRHYRAVVTVGGSCSWGWACSSSPASSPRSTARRSSSSRRSTETSTGSPRGFRPDQLVLGTPNVLCSARRRLPWASFRD